MRESERDRKPSKGVTWSDSVQKRESHDHVVGGFRGREESGRPVRGQEAVRAVKRTEGKFILNTVRLRCSPRDGPAHLPAAFLRHLSQTEPYFIIFILLHDLVILFPPLIHKLPEARSVSHLNFQLPAPGPCVPGSRTSYITHEAQCKANTRAPHSRIRGVTPFEVRNYDTFPFFHGLFLSRLATVFYLLFNIIQNKTKFLIINMNFTIDLYIAQRQF